MTNQAEAMREAAARVAENEARAIGADQGTSLFFMCEDIAAHIRAIPLPEPPPDPRDALIGTDVSDAAIAEEEAREISLHEETYSDATKKLAREIQNYVMADEDEIAAAIQTIAQLSAEIERLENLLALAKAAGGATSRRRRRLMRIEKFDGDKAYVAVNAKYNAARNDIARLSAELEAARAEIFQTRKFWSDHADKDCSALREARAALEGVIAVADRKTVEFDAARAVLAKLSAKVE